MPAYTRLIIYCFVLVGIVFAMFSGLGVFGGPSMEKRLERSATQLNESLPREVREGVKLDFVSAGPGEVLTYHFRLTEQDRQEIDRDSFADLQRENLLRQYREEPEWQQIREAQVEVRHEYADRGGVPFVTISTADP